jgi:hypothetical protein
VPTFNTPPDNREGEIVQASAADSTTSDSVEDPGNPFLPAKGDACPEATFYRPPRLGISHLLAWITAAAIAMKIMLSYERGMEWSSLSSSWYRTLWQIIVYTTVPIHAAALVAMIVLLRDKLCGTAGRFQPGHWFVVLFSSCWLLYLIILLGSVLVPHVVPFLPENSTQKFLTLTHCILDASLSFAFLLVLIMSRIRWHWKAAFALFMGSCSFAAAMSFFSYRISSPSDPVV